MRLAPAAEQQTADETPTKSRRSSSQTIEGTNEIDATAQPSIDAHGDVNGAVDSTNVASTNESIGQEGEVGDSFDAGADEHEYQVEAGKSFETGADEHGHGHEVEAGESFETGADEHEHQDEAGESFEAGADEYEHQDEVDETFDAGTDEQEHRDNGEYEGEASYEDEVDASYYAENEDGHVQETNGEAEHGDESGHINIDTEAAASDAQNNIVAENDGEISYEDDDVDGSLSALVESDEADHKSTVTDPDQNHKEETDEIDYEDDDEVSLLAGSGPTTPAKPLVPGKRPHEDGEANGIDSQGRIYCSPGIEQSANHRTEAKRPRS